MNILDSRLYRLPGLSKSSTFVIKILFLFFSIYYYCLKSIKVFYLPFTLFFFFLSQSKSLKLRNYIDIEALLLFKRELYVIWIKHSNPLKVAKSIKVFYLVIKILFFIFFNLLLLFKVNQSLLSFFHFFYFFKLIKVLELRNYIHIEALLLFKREFNVILTRYSNPLKVQMTKILKYSNPLKMQMTKILIACISSVFTNE